MNNVNIDTDKLVEEINKIKNVNKEFNEIFKQIKNNTETLKDYWSSMTSESVYSSFETFYTTLDNMENTFNTDVEFLEKTVKENYITEEKEINRIVDDKIAM